MFQYSYRLYLKNLRWNIFLWKNFKENIRGKENVQIFLNCSKVYKLFQTIRQFRGFFIWIVNE